MRSLLIVESPAKAKTINKILGNEFLVKASIGHVRDLPKRDFGVDIDKDFTPKYVVIPGKEKIIKELKKAANEADIVYLAPDPDREGEAIAWHIAEEIKKSRKNRKSNDGIYRITFNEITERAVKEAIKRPTQIDLNKVDAQQARRILDRVFGYKLSPLLWRKVRRGLSAGRVQSVAVRLVVEREREIEVFKPTEYWSITVLFEGSLPPQFKARLFRYNKRHIINRDKEQFLLKDGSTANSLLEALKQNPDYILKNLEKKLRRSNPTPPFITSTLQQEASRKLGFSPKRAMAIAQQLYEGIELGSDGSVGLISYMRTDSLRIAKEAQDAAVVYIKERYGKEYLPTKPPSYIKKKQAQDAHEAIRPTYMNKPPELIKAFLTRDQYSLYRLIWQRFIASQMSPAEIEQTAFIISDRDDRAEFRATGNIIKFNGFMAVYAESVKPSEEETASERILPALKEGDSLLLKDINALQHFTQPPPRYSEASLIEGLEDKGIGRPSTYATILSTIQERKYVKKEDGKLIPTDLGMLVNDFLVERFSDLLDTGFTAKMEDELDKIEEGQMKWIKVVNGFYKPFNKDLGDAIKTQSKIRSEDQPTDVICEKCGQPMAKKWGRHGWFLACIAYPRCKNTKSLDKNNGDIEQHKETSEKCHECSATMVVRNGPYGRFLGCSRYPECKITRPLGTGVYCPLDGGEIVERKNRKEKFFWSCIKWPNCKFALWYKPIAEQCPKCGSMYLVEKKDKNGKSTIVCPERGCKYSKAQHAISSEE